MQAPTLRPYQERDLQRVRDLFRTHQSVIRQLPTGGGKGTEAAYLTYHATKNGKRVLFIVDRRALVLDFSENRLDKLGVPHGIIMGSHPKRNAWLNTHVASIDTLYRRLDSLPKADLIIADECRATRAPKWVAVLNAYPKTTRILGFDATPVAPGGNGLGRESGGIFDAIVQGPSVRELIAGGYLVRGRIFHPEGGDGKGLKKQGEEYTHKSLVDVCATQKMVGDAVEKYKLYATGRKFVFFGVDQDHCRRTAEEFTAAGVKSVYVGADTPDRERQAIWDAYDAGDLMGICSYGVISYGWDRPICSCVILGRAVGSMTLLRQMMGRGSRPHKGKQDFIVIDHWDSCGEKNLDVAFEDDIEWALHGEVAKRGERDSVSMSTCRSCRQNFRTGPKSCPYCGLEIQKKVREIDVVEGNMVELVKKAMTPTEWQAKVQGNARFRQLTELYAVQTQRGYKSGYAAMAFKNMFGDWPPKGWLDLAKVGGDSLVG